MAATVTGKLNAAVQFKYTPDSGFYSGSTQNIPINLNATFTSGTSADQVNLVGIGSWTIAPSSSQVIDLTTDLVTPTGAAVNFSTVRHVSLFVVCATDGATVTFAADATNGATRIVSTGGIPIYASTSINNAGFIWNAPNTTAATVDATHKRLSLSTNSTASVTVYLLVAGA